jgi:hypothetical protein
MSKKKGSILMDGKKQESPAKMSDSPPKKVKIDEKKNESLGRHEERKHEDKNQDLKK